MLISKNFQDATAAMFIEQLNRVDVVEQSKLFMRVISRSLLQLPVIKRRFATLLRIVLQDIIEEKAVFYRENKIFRNAEIIKTAWPEVIKKTTDFKKSAKMMIP